MISLLVASPVFDENVYATHSTSITNLQEGCKELGIRMDIAYGLNNDARKELSKMFLNNDQYSHIMYIDSDIEFNANDVIQMLLHDKPVVVADYCKVGFRWDRLTEFINQKHSYQITVEHLQNLAKESYYEDLIIAARSEGNSQDLIQIPRAHSGIIMLQRRVFDVVPLEEWGTETNLEKFLESWSARGGRIYLDTSFRAKHWGKMAF